jgi:hypothetical protein
MWHVGRISPALARVELDDAQRVRDAARAEQARAELDALIDQLTQASALSNRVRGNSASAECARAAVR